MKDWAEGVVSTLSLGLIDLSEDEDGRGAVKSLVILGALLFFGGLWYAYKGGESMPLYPRRLWVAVLGLGAWGVAAGRVWGSTSVVQKTLQADEEEARRAARVAIEGVHGKADVDRLQVPFWVCGDCQICVEGHLEGERCAKCGREEGFIAVEHERERPIARAMLEGA